MNEEQYFRKIVFPICYSLIGVLVSVPFFTVVYLSVLFGLETSDFHNLEKRPNYGQFDFIVIHLGIFGLVSGASISLAYCFGRAVWLLTYGAICCAFFILNREIWLHFDIVKTTYAALVMLITVFALITCSLPTKRFFLRRAEAKLENGTKEHEPED
ncbi:MAG: hypothetical protein AAF456_17870 [Planctomycetota bacterium]